MILMKTMLVLSCVYIQRCTLEICCKSTEQSTHSKHDKHHVTKTVQNGDAEPISDILHIENRIICCIETNLIPI